MSEFSPSTISTATCGRRPAASGSPIPTTRAKRSWSPAGGAETMATLVKQLRAQATREHHLRRRRRSDRRQPVPVGDVSRRAHHRIAVDDGARDRFRRQSRIRRGQGRIAADAERRLSSGRQMPGTASVCRRQVSLPRGLAPSRRAPARPCFPPYEIREFEGIPVAFIGLTLKGTANIVSPPGDRRPRIQGRGRHRERAGAGTEGARRRGHRRADPRGRLSDRRL